LKLLKEDAIYDKTGEWLTSISFTIEGEDNALNNHSSLLKSNGTQTIFQLLYN